MAVGGARERERPAAAAVSPVRGAGACSRSRREGAASRRKARFDGSEADPRPGVAPGHIPGARNLPFASLYREDGRFKPVDEIRRLFEEAGIDPEKPFVATCGSGVTANSLIFAAHLLGNERTKLYDGSWSEWGADPATPKATGSA